MVERSKPTPKNQKEIFHNYIEPYDSSMGAPSIKDELKRGEKISVKNDETKNFSVGLVDIDNALEYYFKNTLKLKVIQDEQNIAVPIIYGSPERWKAVQKDGYYRDKDGKIMAPLLMYKRESIEKIREIGNKLDANNPHNFKVYEKTNSKHNQYDNFSALSNRIPVKEYYGVIIPDYVDVRYKCIVFTNYVGQMNKIVEAINFASDSFWGDKNRFQFRTRIDNISIQNNLETGLDRSIKSEFEILLHGYIIPDTINKELVNIGKFYSKSKINFTFETTTSTEEFNASIKQTQGAPKSVTYFDSVTINSNVNNDILNYLALNNVAQATYSGFGSFQVVNAQIVVAPSPLPATSKNNFQIYINGQYVEHTAILDIYNSGNALYFTIDEVELGFTLNSNMEVIISGKFKNI
jgi:putative sterol carrier protein